MVRAILDGKKTQTRRVVMGRDSSISSDGTWRAKKCPWEGIETLWVRETWCQKGDGFSYAATAPRIDGANGWKPSIHMPRKASRIILALKRIRLEHLQEITMEDAPAEGFTAVEQYAGCFRDGWDAINGKRGYGWETNPLVWALTFERVQP